MAHSPQIEIGALTSEIDELKALLRERGCEYGLRWRPIGYCTSQLFQPCATCRAVTGGVQREGD